MKTRRMFSLVLGLCMFMSFMTAAHADSDGNARIVKFHVMLNGVLVNNINNQYPLLLYKDITYFPLTWDISRFMGLESSWDPSTGLQINKTGNHLKYKASESTFYDWDAVVPVEVANYKITINGESIDNHLEEYPLIIYRGVTYFPLTWRFAVDKFDWDYSWSAENGLTISSGNEAGVANQQETLLSLILSPLTC